MAKAEAEKALAAAKGGKTLADLPGQGSQPAVKRFETEPEGHSRQQVRLPRAAPSRTWAPRRSSPPAIFGAQGPALLDKAYPVNDGWVVAAVTERKLPTDEAFGEEKDKLRAEALRAKEVRLPQVLHEHRGTADRRRRRGINQATERS